MCGGGGGACAYMVLPHAMRPHSDRSIAGTVMLCVCLLQPYLRPACVASSGQARAQSPLAAASPSMPPRARRSASTASSTCGSTSWQSCCTLGIGSFTVTGGACHGCWLGCALRPCHPVWACERTELLSGVHRPHCCNQLLPLVLPLRTCAAPFVQHPFLRRLLRPIAPPPTVPPHAPSQERRHCGGLLEAL